MSTNASPQKSAKERIRVKIAEATRFETTRFGNSRHILSHPQEADFKALCEAAEFYIFNLGDCLVREGEASHGHGRSGA